MCMFLLVQLVSNYCISVFLAARVEIPEDTFWWVDAQFLPYNDAELVVTSTAYIPRLLTAWTGVKKVPQGRILVYDTNSLPISKYRTVYLFIYLFLSCFVCKLLDSCIFPVTVKVKTLPLLSDSQLIGLML